MIRLVRWMLVLTLAAALPVQGVVAATMALCGSHSVLGTATAPAGHGTSGAHGDHGGGGHGHHAAPAQAEPHQCAACAVCAATHGIPSSPAAIESAPHAEVHPDAPVPGVEPFVFDVPERPPRLHLARA